MPTLNKDIKNKLLLNLGVPIIAILLSFIAGGIFILAIGENPFTIYWIMFSQAMGTSYGWGQIIFKMTPLIFTGLAVAFAFRAGLFNIGAEGQLYIGAMMTTIAGYLFHSLPAPLLIPICLLAGFVGGGIWAAIPGVLKAKLGVHEVINTIMMNFIAMALVNYILMTHFSVPETVHTPKIGIGAHLPRLSVIIPSLKASPANFSFFIALIAAFLCWFIIFKTRFGYEIRASGSNPKASRFAGISVPWVTFWTFTISGGLAGLVGTNFVMGYKHYFEEGFSTGVGFMGIAVALLGQNHPTGVILAAFLFGVLAHGGLIINVHIPKELVDILQAIVIIFMVVVSSILKSILVARRKRLLAEKSKGGS